MVEDIEKEISKYEIIYPSEIDIDDLHLEQWTLPRLIKYDSNNNKRIWQAFYTYEKLFRIAGTENAPQIYTLDVEPKVKRTHTQQAFLKARKEYNDKIKQDYLVEDEDYEENGVEVLTKDVMLAKDYKYDPETGASNIEEFPALVQPKLDGIRMLAYKDKKNNLVFTSRKSGNFIYTENHWIGLREEVEELFLVLPKGTQLDGELYSNELTFLEISSVVKTKKKVHKDIDKVNYFIFDIILQSDPTFEVRFQVLVDSFKKLEGIINFDYIKLVLVQKIKSHEDIDIKFNNYIDQGYEGMMIRKIGEGTEYVSGRTSNLLKVKNTYEEEITITDIIECKGNEKGLCKIAGKRESGEEVVVRPSGTFEARKKYLQNKEKYIGKRYTILYNEINPKTGVPRFPRGKGFRDYE